MQNRRTKHARESTYRMKRNKSKYMEVSRANNNNTNMTCDVFIYLGTDISNAAEIKSRIQSTNHWYGGHRKKYRYKDFNYYKTCK